MMFVAVVHDTLWCHVLYVYKSIRINMTVENIYDIPEAEIACSKVTEAICSSRLSTCV